MNKNITTQFREPTPEIQEYRKYRPSKTRDYEDKQILIRETKAINATMDWYRTKSTISVTVQAPNRFLWASTKESQLTYECPHNQSRDAVTELLAHMAQGFVKSPANSAQHEDTCECDECEQADDLEIDELDF